jgi:hypothetical protein
MKTISTIAQAKKAAPGFYSVKDVEGVVFNKRGKAHGAGSFTFRFRFGKERLLMSLGLPDDFDDIEAVRSAATAARRLAREGVNPIAERERARAANLIAKAPATFRQATEAFHRAYAPTLKGKYASQNWLNPIIK